jgi:hypothetical protein
MFRADAYKAAPMDYDDAKNKYIAMSTAVDRLEISYCSHDATA